MLEIGMLLSNALVLKFILVVLKYYEKKLLFASNLHVSE